MSSVFRINNKQCKVILPTIALLMSSTSALGQTGARVESGQSTAQPVMAGDILVTATRASTALSRVPISISAYDQRSMDTQGVRTVDDITSMTPGVTFNRGARSSTVSIRGITSTIGAATTAVYIDDTPTQTRSVGNSPTNAYPRVFDLERVEILRGPQGTLFGASSQGGSIRFITPKPNMASTSLYGRTEFSVTEQGEPNYEAGIAYGAPILEDKIGFRASLWYRRDGGYVDRYTPATFPATTPTLVKRNVNHNEALVGRLAVGLHLGEDIRITPSVYFQRENAPATATFFNTYSEPGKQQYRNGYTFDPFVKDRFYLPALLVEADVGDVSFVSNTSYYDRKFDSYSDYTYYDAALYGSKLTAVTLPGQTATAFFRNTQKNFSQEVRLQSQSGGPLTWVVGAFYSRAKQYQFQDIRDDFINELNLIRTGGTKDIEAIYGSKLLQPGNMFFITDIYTTDEQLAGFAQADYEIVEGLKATLGVRVSKTKFDTTVMRDGPLASGYSYIEASQSETPITPKFGLSWQIDSSNMVYTTVSKGYRPGGAQAQLGKQACAVDLAALGMTETPATFNSDSLWSYEVGTKNRLFDNLLQVDASAYLIKWNDIQQRVSFTTCGGLFVTNQGSATSKGVDVAFTLRPAEGLQLGIAGSYNHAAFDQSTIINGAIMRLQGEKLAVRPLTLSLSGEYRLPNTGDIEPYVRADYQYLAKGNDRNPLAFGYDAGLQRYSLDSVNNLRLRTGIQTRTMEFALFVDNALNDSSTNYGRIAGRSSTILTGTAVRPRTFGIFASYRY